MCLNKLQQLKFSKKRLVIIVADKNSRGYNWQDIVLVLSLVYKGT